MKLKTTVTMKIVKMNRRRFVQSPSGCELTLTFLTIGVVFLGVIVMSSVDAVSVY